MPTPTGRCEFCGVELAASAGTGGRTGRPARFCSNACRQRAYRRRASGGAVPAPPVADGKPGNLPAALDRLVGREHELADLERLIRRARLVTLLGSGGAGKTRLAYELATRARERFPGGVWVVELASLTAGPLLPQHLAATLRIRERAGQAMVETLADVLGAAPTLIVLDNCEHVVEASAALTESLLGRCPGLTVLATSREPLDLPGERIYRIGELTLPSRSGAPSRAELLGSDAIRLFVDRARAASPGFELTHENGADIAGVCTRLDGNPLAIELAARRVRLLPVAEILDRLDDRFGLLTGGSRSALTRHRDLRTAIEWSFDLLEPAEQAVFRRLSVLAGGFTVDGATAVCAHDGVAARSILDLLASLEAKSLIVAERSSSRFRQLESIRLYARDRLAAAGEEDRSYERVVAWLLRLAEPILGEQVARSFEEIEPLDAEQDNLLRALDWTVSRSDPRRVLLAAALGRCWRQRGLATEGRRLLREALAATDPAYPGRSAALTHAARLASMQGEYDEAFALIGEALELERPDEHTLMYVRVLGALGIVQVASGDAVAGYDSSLRCVELVRPLGEPLDTAVCIQNLAYAAVQRGELVHASALMDECLAMYQQRSRHRVPPEWLHTSAMVALANDDLDTAEARLREGLTHQPTRAENGAPAVSGLVMIEGLAVVASRRNDPQRALRLGAAAARFRREQRSEPESGLRRQLEEALTSARTRIGAVRAQVTERAGARLDPEQTVAYALDDMWHDPDQRGGWTSVLTRRELDVAGLVVEGLTNREIAGRLRIAERTVEAHLEHIRAKLDLRSRAQIAGWAVEHGITVPSARR